MPEQRNAFEVWISQEPRGYSTVMVSDKSAYSYNTVQVAWESWKEALQSPEVQALRKDAERLDFLISEECQIQSLSLSNGVRYRLYWPDIDEAQCELYTDPRAAIDAAMEKQK